MSAPATMAATAAQMTRTLPINVSRIGEFIFSDNDLKFLGDWQLELSKTTDDGKNLQTAALELQQSDTPVAFPTETVYGLGADATRSSAVRGIYKAKQRPADNPLIVHISSLAQLRSLLSPSITASSPINSIPSPDPIPTIYHTLISKYWPGPLTILLPLPNPSPFAPEVTNNLPTVGVRMPSSLLAHALLQQSGLALAAPSANASTKPSPTTAAHVLHDLNGRIHTIVDGGPCNVGLESTVVDGLTEPPLILRPGAISIEMLRKCPGWKDVQIGYNISNNGTDSKNAKTDATSTIGPSNFSQAPRAPGMKYRHYSPRAKVIITKGNPNETSILPFTEGKTRIGILSHHVERIIPPTSATEVMIPRSLSAQESQGDQGRGSQLNGTSTGLFSSPQPLLSPSASDPIASSPSDSSAKSQLQIWTISLGKDLSSIARNLFAGLRKLDLLDVEIIFVQGLEDEWEVGVGDLVAAVMNRVRKAAEGEIDLAREQKEWMEAAS